MAKNLVSDLILAPLAQIWAQKLFLWILPLLDVRHCCKLSQYAISRKTKTSKKASFGPNLAHLTQIRAANFFFFFSSKIWLRQSLDTIVSYHHVQHQKKLMIQSWENLVTDRRKDRQTDKQIDFIGRCPTIIERSKYKQSCLNRPFQEVFNTCVAKYTSKYCYLRDVVRCYT